MLLDIAMIAAIVLVVIAASYAIGWFDGREAEERHWINSYNNCGLDDGKR